MSGGKKRGGDGPKSYIDAMVKCPFYLSAGQRKSVLCEAVIPSATADITRFRTERGFRRHVAKFCAARYEECPKHAAISEKYKEDGDNA